MECTIVDSYTKIPLACDNPNRMFSTCYKVLCKAIQASTKFASSRYISTIHHKLTTSTNKVFNNIILLLNIYATLFDFLELCFNTYE